MRFTEKTSKYQHGRCYDGKKDNFLFEITKEKGESLYFVYVEHSKKDISYNSRLNNIGFDSFGTAVFWCENFNYLDNNCNGKDI